MELREDKALIRIRKWLAEADIAYRTNNTTRAAELKKEYREATKLENISKETLIMEGMPEASLQNLEPVIALNAPISGLVRYLIVWSNKTPFLALQNLNKQLFQAASINEKTMQVFKSEIPEREIKHFQKLRAFQDNYLLND